MAYINLMKELLVSPQSALGQQLYSHFEANPLPISTRIYHDTYPSAAMVKAIEETIPNKDGGFFDNVLHALSFYIGKTEIYVAFHPNAEAPYISLLSYSDALRQQFKPYLHRTIISASATRAVNLQRLKDFFQNIFAANS